MAKKVKRIISSVLALALAMGSMVTANVSSVFAAGKTVDVWDFGGVAQADADGVTYTNHITTDQLDALEAVGDEASGNKGKFLATGPVDFGSGLSVTANANDRLFYLITDDGTGSTGLRSYGANGKAIKAYDDGYTANGMFYCNGTGGDTRRFVQVDGVNAGDVISAYTGPSNSADSGVEFTYLGTDGEQSDEYVVPGGSQDRVDFVAKFTGSYKLWWDATTNPGKPTLNRVVRYPATTVTGTINTNGLAIPAGYGLAFDNNTTGNRTVATLNADNSFTADLASGYEYKATLTNATGFGFTNATKNISLAMADIAGGKAGVSLSVETKSTYVVSGSVTGIADGYDVSQMTMTLTPTAESLADVVTPVLDTATMTYSATLEPDIDYTASFEGINDYEITAGGVINDNKNVTHDITLAEKAIYNVSGNLLGNDETPVTAIAFTNVDDGYVYEGTVAGDGYNVLLRDGSYAVSATVEGYKTSTHVVVKGKALIKDILFVPTVKPTPTVEWNADIYVGMDGGTYSYDTMGEALAAAKAMNPTDEAHRITIHIAPGVYREQLTVDTPYLTFVKEGEGEAVLTWYYGIGYQYYSIDGTGYYNEENAFDQYSKGKPSKWGVATYVKNTATGFKADGIVFETSFSKYITDEEIEDGVESDGTIAYVRKINSDPTSKAATERATAICVESDNTEFRNCEFIGSQDTLYMGDNTHTYYKNCMIEGNTDYIFGSGNAVFDGCELRFCGYSDVAMAGYLTAGRSNNAAGYKGYLFRGCEITQKAGMLHAPEYLGRPWDQNANITFLNTKVNSEDTIAPAGWTSMSGVAPEAASYHEFNTTFNGTPVDTASRTANTVMTAEEAAAVNPTDYFGTFAPTYYVADNTPVEFSINPYLSSDCDIAAPETGYFMNVKYELKDNAENDASLISWYRVDESGAETLVQTNSAKSNNGYKMGKEDIGYLIKATVTPMLASGAVGTAKSVVTGNKVVQGSGRVDPDRPSGKNIAFLAGDSTVKDYSAGAINNAGANRVEGSWGEFLETVLDDNDFAVMDYAEGGRSSKTFISDGFLKKITDQMVAGDYLFVQFAHNDCAFGNADRYVPVGTPDANGVYPSTEGTFKYYLQQYVNAAKAVGAIPVMVTPISRMYFNEDGTIKPHHDDDKSLNNAYVTAVKQVAEENGIACFDLFDLTKTMYEDAYKADPEAANGVSPLATRLFAPGEKTHNSKLGGFAIACKFAELIKASNLDIASEIVYPTKVTADDDKGTTEFMVDSTGYFIGYDKNASGAYDPDLVDTYWTEFVNNSITALKGFVPPVETRPLGDVDNDKAVTANDAALALAYCLTQNTSSLTAEDVSYAEVDDQDGITSMDSAYILQKSLDSTFLMPAEK